MQTEHLISADECCTHYNVEIEFISALNEYGLIRVIDLEEKKFIDAGELQNFEKFVRMRYDLDINMEGLEAINHLLQRIENLQHQISNLRNRLQL